MSKGNNGKGLGKQRKKGDWQAIARGRSQSDRVVRLVDPLTCAPKVTETGSAAYRRRIASQARRVSPALLAKRA